MTSPPSTAAATHPDPDGAPTLRHPATPGQLAWLDTQLTAWQSEGLVDAPTANRLRARYVAHRRLTLARIVLTLGAAFVGIGLVWTVAANLDAVSPLVRILLVALVWLGLVVAAEVLQRRREHLGDVASPVVGAVRLLAAAAFGAVVFQAAQSLQVPADRYQPSGRSMPSKLPQVEYDEHEIVRAVPRTKGYICFKGRLWKVPEAFRGERLAIRPRGKDGCYAICFASHQVATIDLTKPKCVGHVSEQVSAMSPG